MMEIITHVIFFLAGLGISYYVTQKKYHCDQDVVNAAREILEDDRLQEEAKRQVAPPPAFWPNDQKAKEIVQPAVTREIPLQETPMKKVLTNAEAPRSEAVRTELTYDMDKYNDNVRAWQNHLKTHKMVG